VALLAGWCGVASSCIRGQVATDLSDPGFPFGPSSINTQPVAYVQDIKPIFDRDCLSCHGGREFAGDYSVSSYANTMVGQRPGDASSRLVVVCSPGGSMYEFFSGDQVAKATAVFRWIVVYQGAQTR
jgi:hypothetical protein